MSRNYYMSFNCESGNHGGCNEFHLGCVCDHHPLGKHLTAAGRYSFVDVDTYPSATVEELETHRFYDPQAGKHLEDLTTVADV